MESGYLYVVSTDKYVKELVRSIASLRLHDKNANITVVTDVDGLKEEKDLADNIILQKPDKSTESWTQGLYYKVENIYRHSPYEKTFFVDTDTVFLDSCVDLFDILDFYDLSLAVAPADVHYPFFGEKQIFGSVVFNTGVFLYRKNKVNEDLFMRWKALMSEKMSKKSLRGSDQTVFMEVLAVSGSRVNVHARGV